MCAWGTVYSRTADRYLDAFIARRLSINARLIGQHILVTGHTPLQRTAHIDHVGATGYLVEPDLGILNRLVFIALLFSPDQHLPQLHAFSGGHGRTKKGQA